LVTLQLQTPYQDATSLFGLPGKTNLSSHLSLWHGRPRNCESQGRIELLPRRRYRERVMTNTRRQLAT